MRRFPLVLVPLLLVALALPLSVSAQSVAKQTTGSEQDLAAKVEALEKRLTLLERSLSQRLASIERKVASGGGGNAGATPAQETEARAAWGKVNQLMAAGDYDQAKTELNALLTKYPTTNTARSAASVKRELDIIGKPAPSDWGIEEWFQGESDIDLNNGKATLVVFWELWCPHCKREVPKLQALYTKMKGEGLQIIGLTRLSKSSTEEAVREFIAQQNVTYPVAKENGSSASHFGVRGIPAAAVVKDGEVVWRGHPSRLTEAQIKGWL